MSLFFFGGGWFWEEAGHGNGLQGWTRSAEIHQTQATRRLNRPPSVGSLGVFYPTTAVILVGISPFPLCAGGVRLWEALLVVSQKWVPFPTTLAWTTWGPGLRNGEREHERVSVSLAAFLVGCERKRETVGCCYDKLWEGKWGQIDSNTPFSKRWQESTVMLKHASFGPRAKAICHSQCVHLCAFLLRGLVQNLTA